MNWVFRVQGAEAAICVKQALPFIRVIGPDWPMTAERATFEHRYYNALSPFAAEFLPRVLDYDEYDHVLFLEFLDGYSVLRQGLIAGRTYPHLPAHMGGFLAEALYGTSIWAEDRGRSAALAAAFSANAPMFETTAKVVFTGPLSDNPLNRWTSPQLDETVVALKADRALYDRIAALQHRFLNTPQALLHGDLHTGSVMAIPNDTRIIDPEFALYGPAGFDIGAFIGNLLLNFFAQEGHASGNEDRSSHRTRLLRWAEETWRCFAGRFTAHVDDKAVLAQIYSDTLAFAGCVMIRRLIGISHVADFEAIADPAVRAPLERQALDLARRLVMETGSFGDMAAVTAAARATAGR